MKKTLALSTAVVLAAPIAQAEVKMPTFYGKVNKAIMYVDQEAKFNRKTNTGVVDVESSESRLGAKGSYDLGNMKAKYKIEVGVSSSSSNGIRVRVGKADLVTKFGTFTLGQDYVASATVVKSFDVFKGTVAQGSNKDYYNFVENSSKHVGYHDRSRADLLKYSTPKFAGLQYTISQDKGSANSKDSNKPGTAQATNTEHLISFSKEMGKMSFNLNAAYIHWAEANSGDQSEMIFGGHFKMDKLAFRAGYGIEKQEKDSGTTNDIEDTRMIFGVSYKLGSGKVMLGYSAWEEETKPLTGTTTKEEETHLNVGYAHSFNKYVSINGIFTSLKLEQTTGNATNDAAYKNDASIISFGTTIKF
jgi:predicted porin